MGLRNEICDACSLRDKGSQSPFLMSTDNEMDLGDIPAYLRSEFPTMLPGSSPDFSYYSAV